jgi:dihydroorotate dehydrogenase
MFEIPRKNLFISPPFGNYINLPGVVPIRGSFTLNERKGKWKQIFKTLRYIPILNGWVNKIGLRNPGIDYAIRTYKKGEIISIAILEPEDIDQIEKKIPKDMDIELNVSCPNTDKHLVNSGLSIFLNNEREWCIIKLSPVENQKQIDEYYKQGFRQFHCSNTLPIQRGGLSGPLIKVFNKDLIKYIRNKYNDNVEIIGGGGIRTMDDIKFYNKLGVNHYSVSSLCFNPVSFLSLYYNFFK